MPFASHRSYLVEARCARGGDDFETVSASDVLHFTSRDAKATLSSRSLLPWSLLFYHSARVDEARKFEHFADRARSSPDGRTFCW